MGSGVRVGNGVPSRAGVAVGKRRPPGGVTRPGSAGTITGDTRAVATGERTTVGEGTAVAGPSASGVGVPTGTGDPTGDAAETAVDVGAGLTAAGDGWDVWTAGVASAMVVPVSDA